MSPADLSDQVMAETNGLPDHDVDIGVGVYVWNDKQVKGLLHNLRDRSFQGRIVLGGPQISYASQGLEQIYPKADVFVRGYAEAALCALARSDGRPKIQGVHYAGEADCCKQVKTALRNLPSPWCDANIELDQNSSSGFQPGSGPRRSRASAIFPAQISRENCIAMPR